MNRLKRIRLLETTVFIVLTLTVLYLGADHPVPEGFGLLVLIVLTVAVLQHVYICWLHNNLTVRKTFLKTILLGSAAAIASTLFLIALYGHFNRETLIWLFLITRAGALYGALLWGINFLLIRKIH